VTPVVLDTCVALWLAGQQDALSATARGVLADPQVTLFISAISAWEIAVKSRKGKLGLPTAPEVWWETSRA
jgi:PIN domain nuclease of toxin-antitoxin system